MIQSETSRELRGAETNVKWTCMVITAWKVAGIIPRVHYTQVKRAEASSEDTK